MIKKNPKESAEPKVAIAPPSADAWVEPDCIERNPANPRLIFNQKQLDDLKKSIFEVGILQPLVVYERTDGKGTYVLIDGERRWRSARELNLHRIPVHIHKEPTPVQNLTMMFNIHKLRVDWELMPTALSLKTLMDLSGETRQRELARMTGLSPSMVSKSINLLSFSEKHQQLVLNHKVKDNLLLEIYDVLRAIEKRLPAIAAKRGEEEIVDRLLEKDQKGFITTVTDLRDLRKVVDSTARGAPTSAIARIVNRVLDKPSYRIEEAYSKVRSLYDVHHLTTQFSRLADEISNFNPDGIESADLIKLERQAGRLGASIDSLLKKVKSAIKGRK